MRTPLDTAAHHATSPEDTATSTVSPDHVVEVAMRAFAERGFDDTKLDAISRESGLSKRMIHYHFGDKRGLYQQCLRTAANLLQVPEGELQLDTDVPVEGVSALINAMWDRFVAHPVCLRLLVMENYRAVFDPAEASPIESVAPMTLYLDRLLLLGQDSGAFRPCISAQDIFALICAIVFFRSTNHAPMLNLYGIDLTNAANTEGMRRLVIDAVLAFLTAQIPDDGHPTYLTAEAEDSDRRSEKGAASNLYDDDSALNDVLFIDE
ncbi:TetR/AcrR family transcriptional regulator [Corynebacterium uterequi]|uniref:Transcriptional regulator, TetR family n=1 Tax=Corynebacterium uterequi TaxID=1072256 RepID=A0A0G3HEA7_9CORY|nr:TetR/AcrR family transcriptional regulator [Corynebacterium uterequi]AKK11651.1 transcriptional regulator, TetR family [Corynebacterium uterequi]